jgi:hypothetical protein
MFPRLPGVGTPHSEVVVFERLRECPRQWLVFHDVGWVSARRGRQVNGQTDFVVAIPRRGLIVLEVKGGEIRVENGAWETRPRNADDWVALGRSPVKQAEDARYRLHRRLMDALSANVPMGHAVVFPAGAPCGELGMDAPNEVLLSRYDLPDIRSRLGGVADYWDLNGPFEPDAMAAVRQLLAPTTAVTISLRGESGLSEAALTALTTRQIELNERQIEITHELSRLPRAVVLGGAGTGKTILAVERAKRLAADGSRVLLACHRPRLAEHIKRLLGVYATSATAGYIRIAPRGEAYSRMWKELGADRFNELHATGDPYALLLAYEPELAHRALYDAIVLDEGQEFDPGDVGQLMRILADPECSPVYVFADPFQQRHGRASGWTAPPAFPTLALVENCRNTRPIAELAEHIGGVSPSLASAHGVNPRFEKSDDVPTRVAEVVAACLREGFVPGDIAVVVVASAELRERIHQHLEARSAGSTAVLMAARGSTLADSLNKTHVALLSEYHGLERQVVVVVADEPYVVDRDRAELVRRDLYIGSTRARSLLYLVGTAKVIRHLKALATEGACAT